MIEENNLNNVPGEGEEGSNQEEQQVEATQEEPQEEATARPIFRGFSGSPALDRLRAITRFKESQFKASAYQRWKAGLDEEPEAVDTDKLSFGIARGIFDRLNRPEMIHFNENINNREQEFNDIFYAKGFPNLAAYNAFQERYKQAFEQASTGLDKNLAQINLLTQYNPTPRFGFFQDEGGAFQVEPSSAIFDGEVGLSPLVQYYPGSESPRFMQGGLATPMIRSYDVPVSPEGRVSGSYYTVTPGTNEVVASNPLLYSLSSNTFLPGEYLFKNRRKNKRLANNIIRGIGTSGVDIFNEKARIDAVSGGAMQYFVSGDISNDAPWESEGETLYISSEDFNKLDEGAKKKILGSVTVSHMGVQGRESKSLIENPEEVSAIEQLMDGEDSYIAYTPSQGSITFMSSKDMSEQAPLGEGQQSILKANAATEMALEGFDKKEEKALEETSKEIQNYLNLVSLFGVDGAQLMDAVRGMSDDGIFDEATAYGLLRNELEFSNAFEVINGITSDYEDPRDKAQFLLENAGSGFTEPFRQDVESFLIERGMNPTEVQNLSGTDMYNAFVKEFSGTDWVEVGKSARKKDLFGIYGMIDEYLPFLTDDPQSAKNQQMLADATADFNEELAARIFVTDYYKNLLEAISVVDLGEVYTLEDGTPMLDDFGNTMSAEKLDLQRALVNSIAEDEMFYRRLNYTPSIIDGILENKDAARAFREATFTSTFHFSKLEFLDGEVEPNADNYGKFLKETYPEMDNNTLRQFKRAFRKNPYPVLGNEVMGGSPGGMDLLAEKTINNLIDPINNVYRFFAFTDDEAALLDYRNAIGVNSSFFNVRDMAPANIKYERQGDYVALNGGPLAFSDGSGNVMLSHTMIDPTEGTTGYKGTITNTILNTTSSLFFFMGASKGVGYILPRAVKFLSPAAAQITQLAIPSFVMSLNDLNRDESFAQQMLSKAIYATSIGVANRFMPSIERLSIGKSFGVGPLGAASSELVEEKLLEPLFLDMGRAFSGLEYSGNMGQSVSSFQTVEGNIENAVIMLSGGLMSKATNGSNNVDLANNRALAMMMATNPYEFSSLVKLYTKNGIVSLDQAVKLVNANRQVYRSMAKLNGIDMNPEALGSFLILDNKRLFLEENKPEGYEKDLDEVNTQIEQLMDVNKKHQEAIKDNDYVINGEVVSKEQMFEYLESGYNNGDLVYISGKDNASANVLADQKAKAAIFGKATVEMGDPLRYIDQVTDLDIKTKADDSQLAGFDAQVEAAASSLSKSFPEVKFKIHPNEGSFIAATGIKAKGAFDPEFNVIHINAARADKTTVGHEVFEAVVFNSMNSDQAVRVDMVELANDIMNDVDEDTKAQLESFISQYESGDVSKEAVSQFFGIVSANTNTEAVTDKSANFFNKLASKFGLINEVNTDEDAISLIKAMAGDVAAGKPVGQVVTMEGERSMAMAAQLDDDLGAQKDLDLSESEYKIRRALDNANRQQDGSYVFNEVPPEGLDYTVKRGGPLKLGRKQYIVSGENFDAFISESFEKSARAKAGFEAKMEYLNKGMDDINVSQVRAILESLVYQNNPQAAEQIYQEFNENLLKLQGETFNELDPTEAVKLVDIINKGYESMGSSRRVSGPEIERGPIKINVAPFFKTVINTVEDANALRQTDKYKQAIETIKNNAASMGMDIVSFEEGIGGYVNRDGDKIQEVSFLVQIDGNQTLDDVEKLAAILGGTAPEVQEVTIAGQYTDAEADGETVIDELSIKTSPDSAQDVLDALRESDIFDFTYNQSTGEITFLDFDSGKNAEFEQKFNNFESKLNEKNIEYEKSARRAVESRYIDQERRQELISSAERDAVQQGQGGTEFHQALIQAIERSAEFEGKSVEEYLGDRDLSELKSMVQSAQSDEIISQAMTSKNEDIDNIVERVKAGEDVTYEEYKEAITLSEPKVAIDLYREYVNRNDKVDADLYNTINESLEQMRSPIRIDQYGVQTNIERQADLRTQEEMKAAVDARVKELEASIDGTNAEEEIVAESDPEATIERIQEEVKGVIEKTKERWNEEKAMGTTLEEQQYENALAYARGTKAYQEGDSETRGQIIDMVKNEMGVSLTEAQGRPEKMTGTQIVIDSYQQMKRELEIQEKAGKLAVDEQQKAERDIIAKINEQFKESGIYLTPAQVKRIYDLIARTDMTNPDARARVEMESAKIINQNRGKVLVDQFKALRDQYKAEERAGRQGKMTQRKATREAGLAAIELLKDATLSLPRMLSNAQTRALLRILTTTDFTNEAQAAKAEAKIDKMISDKKFSEKIKAARETIRKARKNISKNNKLGADPLVSSLLNQVFNMPTAELSMEEAPLISGETVFYDGADAEVIVEDADGVALRLKDGTEISVSRDDITHTFLDRQIKLAERLAQRKSEISLGSRESMIRQAESILNNLTELEEELSEAQKEESEMSPEEKARMSEMYFDRAEPLLGFYERIVPDTGVAEVPGDAYIQDIIERIPNKDSRAVFIDLQTMSREDFDALPLKKQALLVDVLQNARDGFITHNAYRLARDIKANRASRDILDKTSGKTSASDVALNLASRIRGYGVRKFSPGKKSQYNQMLRLNPKIATDRLLGNFNDSSVYNATWGKLDSSFENYEADLNKFQSKLQEASNLIGDFKGVRGKGVRMRNAARVQESRFLIKALELQREWDSNPGMRDSKVFEAKEWIDERINDPKVDPKEVEILKRVKDKLKYFEGVSFEEGLEAMKKDGAISENEIKAFDIISEVNSELSPYSLSAASLYRGGSAESYVDYTRHKVEGVKKRMQMTSLGSSMHKQSALEVVLNIRERVD